MLNKCTYDWMLTAFWSQVARYIYIALNLNFNDESFHKNYLKCMYVFEKNGFILIIKKMLFILNCSHFYFSCYQQEGVNNYNNTYYVGTDRY